MFYKLIKKKCDEWLRSSECTIRELIQYIHAQNKMRDAQIEAIQIYLFLKIVCGNKPLWQLFSEGIFNSLDLNAMALTLEERELFISNKGAAALLEYSLLKDKNGDQIAPELEKFLKKRGAQIDYEAVFQKIFYGVTYTDYLFSLPMGAGKTYLMAAFIYLDLYFAQNEPDNPAFAHNFMVLAPSGLKSSIVPSLKNIQSFDPTWVIPEPTASQLKRMIKFEILDEQKSARKSNLVRNPNAQKINNHQPLEDLMGLVAITNAEKVILDRAGKSEDLELFDKEEQARIRMANELRNIIGKIPHLAVFIDEVHHAADGEIKLRQVVEEWTKGHSFCGVLGFSGTPYLDKTESVALSENFAIKNTELSNVVYYYPLIEGLGNFLKIPEVKYADNDTETIVRNGVREFLDKYRDTVYENGTCAKLAIYCGQIETLEEMIYPQVARILSEYGLDSAEVLLKYHGGNKTYPQPEGAETEFASLDMNFSRIRIVLLVQIGKEGWDCKSLTGVILPQKGVCPTNMVLQTSCRCLRQVTRNARETALIWLNKFNADTLNKQLKQQQNISLQEFNNSSHPKNVEVERFSRMERLRVPPVDFYQLKVSYQTLITEEHPHTAEKLASESLLQKADVTLIHRQDLSGKALGHYLETQKNGETVSFHPWLYLIVKESFHTLTLEDLRPHLSALERIFHCITTINERGETCYDNQYDQEAIRSSIRKAFVCKRGFSMKEEIVPRQVSLLQIERLISPLVVEDDHSFFPSREEVRTILDWDENARDKSLTPEELAVLESMKQKGYSIPEPADPHPERARTYHYLPYRFDSGLEYEYFRDSIIPILQENQWPLEIYFNGDDTLTDFKIDCYKQVGGKWRYIGKYVPDFLLLSRKEDGTIDRIIIIETKGEGFAAKFADRRYFMETEFIHRNNECFGYERFRFLYLEEGLGKEEREKRTIQAIQEFFNN